MRILSPAIILLILLIGPLPIWARGGILAKQDTSRSKNPADSATKSQLQAAGIKSDSSAIKGRLAALNPGGAASKVKLSPADSIKNIKNNKLYQSLSNYKKKPSPVDLTFRDDGIYNPIPLFPNTITPPKFMNVFSVTGNIQLSGLPVNVDYATDRASSGNQQGIRNNLFKFDFNAQQLNSTLKSDIQQYNGLRSGAFGGYDLTTYTSKTLTSDLLKSNAMDVSPNDRALAKYLDNPVLVNQLLKMNPDQVRTKLNADLANKQQKLADSAGNLKMPLGKRNMDAGKARRLRQRLEDIKDLQADSKLRASLNKPAGIPKLRLANAAQLRDTIHFYHQVANPQLPSIPEKDNAAIKTFFGADVNFMIDRECNGVAATYESVVEQTSHDMFISLRLNNKSGYDTSLARQQQKVLYELNMANSVNPVDGIQKARATPQQIDSITNKISGIRQVLQNKGLDMNRMLQMQQLLSENSATTGVSEQLDSYAATRPQNGAQSLFSNINELKGGSFGNNVNTPASNQDIFMTGTHLTFNTGLAPLTVGYGSLNDINSIKDAGFQNSVYNEPRNLTYLGTELTRAPAGPVKFTIVSSVNSQLANSSYSLPTVSQNDVDITMSKDLNFDKVGKFEVDISKSTTLYGNKFEPGAEAILDKQGGMNNNLSSELFSAMSFGVTHQLDMKDINASDNLYFSYAGMGYQNPAVNGRSGARIKMGGNIKKSFYKNKLTFNLRSDLNNMPISYTSNDEWKTYLAQLDTRYIFSKKFNLSIKYIANSTNKRVDDISTPVYSFRKIEVDGNVNYKIGRYFTSSHFTVGKQSFSDSYASQDIGSISTFGSPSTTNTTTIAGQDAGTGVNTAALQGSADLLMFNYTQSTVIKSNTLTLSVFYNKELSSFQLIGNMLNADLGYQYMLFGKLNFSTGVTYLANDQIARQAGIRQGVQLFSSSSFDIDTYVDLRKNLITPLYPDLYASCRAELSLKYHFRNKR